MKKLLNSLPFKIASVITSYVLVLIIIASITATLFMGYSDFYTSSKNNVYEDFLGGEAYGKAYALLFTYGDETEFEYILKDSNIYYEIKNPSGEVVATNYNGQEYILTAKDDYEGFSCTVYIPAEMTHNDRLALIKKLIDIAYGLKYAIPILALISLIGFIALVCYLCCAAGHKKDFDGIYIGYLDMIPTDIYGLLLAIAYYISYVLISGYFYFEGAETIIVVAMLGTVLYFLTLSFVISLAKRIKTHTIFKNTVIYRAVAIIVKGCKAVGSLLFYLLKKLPLVWKALIIVTSILIIQAIYMLITLEWYNVTAYIIWFLFNLVIAAAIIYFAIVMQTIKKGGDRIASGDITYKIDTKYMILDFKTFANQLNCISDGLNMAVNEKMKSEMFKTELITNVSHDIKTPLTSIINYVDLLKKEDIENENAKEYISVLNRQSERLKRLIEDLVDASKAATGNLTVNSAPCDIGVLLSQSIGEFDEKLKTAQITPLLKKPEKSVIIMADARHLWRVCDNLLNNICKYALNSTRAYIDVAVINNKAVITFKNISKYELNISANELMERFVRGDKSRHTDGSGLGLSIAKSLTELQNGKMDIEIDGDLFKVSLTFDIAV